MNNCDSATRWGDAAELFDNVSSDYESELPSAPALQDADSMDIIDKEFDHNVDYGIRNFDSYFDICTKNLHLACHQVCAIIAAASGARTSEEYDSLGNPMPNPENVAMNIDRERGIPPEGNRNEDREGEGNHRVNHETGGLRNRIQVQIP
jgi:hypothetical protein